MDWGKKYSNNNWRNLNFACILGDVLELLEFSQLRQWYWRHVGSGLFTSTFFKSIEDPKVLLGVQVLSVNISVFKIKTKKPLKCYCKIRIHLCLVVVLCAFKENFKFKSNDLMNVNEVSEKKHWYNHSWNTEEKIELTPTVYFFIL